jgi:hypothetical protein
MTFEYTKGRVFTSKYSDKDYQVTRDSKHPQTSLWPEYLPIQEERLCIFERSKNAQLVVYTANYLQGTRQLNPKWPIDIFWQSFGWTDSPTSNPTGMVERKMAWGYSHKQVHFPFSDIESLTSSLNPDFKSPVYSIALNALPSRQAFLYLDEKQRVVLRTKINGIPSRLYKIYVSTSVTSALIPKVLYVELYGQDLCGTHGQETYEKIHLSSTTH